MLDDYDAVLCLKLSFFVVDVHVCVHCTCTCTCTVYMYMYMYAPLILVDWIKLQLRGIPDTCTCTCTCTHVLYIISARDSCQV